MFQQFNKINKINLIITFSVVFFLILGGTFFAISQNDFGQNLASNSSNSSSISIQNSSLASVQNPINLQSSNSSSNMGDGITTQNKSGQTFNSSQSKILETAFLEKCGLEIRYNPDKYYITKPYISPGYSNEARKNLEEENLFKMEIHEKNLSTSNQTIINYQCNLDNYNFYTVSTTQKLFPSPNYKIPLFSQSFWDKTVEAGRIEFSGNVANRKPEEFPLDWFLVKNEPNFEAGIKTQNTQNNTQKTIFHQIILRNDPVGFDGKNLQFGLIDNNSKATKNILSYEDFEKVQPEEIDKNTKKIKKFQNWDQIKFDGKVNKISDIPESLIKKYGVPQFGFRFYKGVAFWSGYLKGGTENTEQNSKDGSLIAFDGQKVVEIKSESGQEFKNYFGYEIGTYYLSSLIKDGVGYNFNNSCGGWGCFTVEGFFIDFDKGQYWISKGGADKENYNKPKVDQKLLEPYLIEDFPSWKGLGQPRISVGTGYQLYKNGNIYGRFQKYTGKVKDGVPENTGFFLVESDGQNYKFLFEVKNDCSTRIDPCSANIFLNSRNNLVSLGYWTGENFDPNKPETNNIKITEQDFWTGKILAEEIFQEDNVVIYQKYGILKPK